MAIQDLMYVYCTLTEFTSFTLNLFQPIEIEHN